MFNEGIDFKEQLIYSSINNIDNDNISGIDNNHIFFENNTNTITKT